MTAPTYSCLGFDFGVHASEPALAAWIDELYLPFRTEVAPAVVYTVVEWDMPSDAPVFAVFRDAERVRLTEDPHIAVAHLVWEISREVQQRPQEGLLLLHAAAAASNGSAVLLPAESGAGKSTLVAALVSEGFGYLTDDLTVVDVVTGRVVPYPKPIGVDRTIWPRLGVEVDHGTHLRFSGPEGYLSIDRLGGRIAEPATPVAIVAPRYRPCAPTVVESLDRAAAIELFARQSFNLHGGDAVTIRALSDLIRSCTCHRLEYSDLADGVATIRELLSIP